MQDRKRVVLLLALVLAAGVVLAPSHAEAQTVLMNSVEIVSPANGTLLGIGKQLVAKAVVTSIPKNANQSVIFYLVTTDSIDVVTDNTSASVVNQSNATVPEATFLVAITNAATASELNDRGDSDNDKATDDRAAAGTQDAFGVTGSAASAQGIVLAQQTFGPIHAGSVFSKRSDCINEPAATRACTDVVATKTDGAATTITGDGDSITVVSDGDAVTVTWYYSVTAAVGTISGVRVAAVGVDPTSGDRTALAVSPAGRTVNLDGDRPSDSDLKLLLPNDVVLAATACPASCFENGSGTTEADKVTFKVNGGPATADGKAIFGIGDSLRFRVDLGNSALPVITGDLDVVLNVAGDQFVLNKGLRTGSVLRHKITIAPGTFTEGKTGPTAVTQVAVFLRDAAGNLSSSTLRGADPRTSATATGVTSGADFYVDDIAPVLDGELANGDTILPKNGATITDGTLNAFAAAYTSANSNAKKPTFLAGVDLAPITYQLAEPLDILTLKLDGATTDATITIDNAGGANTNAADPQLSVGAQRVIDFTAYGPDGPTPVAPQTVLDVPRATRILQAGVEVGTAISGVLPVIVDDGTAGTTADKTPLKEGLYTITLQGTDLAGNKGTALSRTNVYIDNEAIKFQRFFPTNADEIDSLNAASAVTAFSLSEHADSVEVSYIGTAGADVDKQRTRRLTTGELVDDKEQDVPVLGLVDLTQYTLIITGVDPAGNFSQLNAGTFAYNESYLVKKIAQFTITSNVALVDADKKAIDINAGAPIVLTVQARTTDVAVDAVTYKSPAILKVAAGTGVTLTGTGVTDLGNGRAELDRDGWKTGGRTVTLKDTTSVDVLTVSVQDCTDAANDNIFTGALANAIHIAPAPFNKILLSADGDIGQGDVFWVDVTLADIFGNTRIKDAGFVTASTNVIGVSMPTGAIEITKGVGRFQVNSHGYSGDLTIAVRDVAGAVAASTIDVDIDGDGATVLDDPDELIGEDYMGALGGGDQGGFILLTFDVSADHESLSGYRIYRDISGLIIDGDGPGGLVELGTAATFPVPWGRVDAIPGAKVMRVVIATLDGDETDYEVAAERNGLTTKEAFDVTASVSSSYELMAETMVNSKQAAVVDPTAPVFATLTPEALAFQASGVAPRLKSTDGVLLSSLRKTTEPVRAIDNIAPAPVAFVNAIDTPGDTGGSITVQWAKSVDDRMLTTSAPNAIGEFSTYTTAGVAGYNLYRKIGDGAWQMVGQAPAGQSSFEDATVLNGVRYAYKVEPYDADNITTSEFVKSAMAIRNNVVDVDGQRIVGLFGADNRVDYDDFFIFADHYGMTAGQEAYEPAFDLSGNNVIDLDDFFQFADNFGRQAVGVGKAVPMMAGLNSDARFYFDSAMNLPRVGEEMALTVNLEDFVEVRGYGLTVKYDSEVLEFVEPRVTDNGLGESALALPQSISQADGEIFIAAYGDAADGDLGVDLVFRSTQEIEDSYVEITGGTLQDGSYGLNQITTPVSVRIETRPEVYALADNYPNPFNPETTIKYQLPEAGQVTLEVYNMLGQVVRTLVSNEFQNAGRYTHQWDATNDSGQPLSSGVYFYRIVAGGEFQSHKKMLLLK